MTVSINPKLLELGYGERIHMLNVREAIDRLRPDFRDSVLEMAAGLRRRFSSRGETAASLHPVSVIPVLYRQNGVMPPRRKRDLEVEPQPGGMTLTGGALLLAWAVAAEVTDVPAINLDQIEDVSELVMAAAGGPELLWPAQYVGAYPGMHV